MHYIVWILIAAFMFSVMGLTAKLSSSVFSNAEMVFYRGIINLVIVYLLAKQQNVSLATNFLGQHIWRSLSGCCALLLSFYAITQLPLATASTLNYMSSLWVGVFILMANSVKNFYSQNKTNFPVSFIFILAFGFLGVIILLQPTINSNQLNAGIIGLIAGMLAALAYIQVANLSKLGEPSIRVVFYFSIGCIVFGFVIMLLTNSFNWDWYTSIWLLPLGLSAALGQICLTKAYGLAKNQRDMLTVANLQYIGIVFSAIWGYVIFDDLIGLIGWLGIVIIITSGVLSSFKKH